MSLQRSTPLRRSPMKRKRPRRLDRETPTDTAYRAWVHAQPCVGRTLAGHRQCTDRLGFFTDHVEQSHIRSHTGIGRKPPERQSLPMCGALHVNWEERSGVFEGISDTFRQEWAKPLLDDHWKRFQAAYIEQGGVLAP